ncbi:MAG: hypothetical protein ACKO8O_18675 [Betaproteobacteria bacterium]
MSRHAAGWCQRSMKANFLSRLYPSLSLAAGAENILALTYLDLNLAQLGHDLLRL